MSLSVFLIARNEEKKIGRALDSVAWADERLVVDGGSTDKTVEICEEKGAKIYRRLFDNFGAQKNYALSRAKGEWVLSLDSDETIPEPLAREMTTTVSNPHALDGYRIKRRNYFLGKPLRFGRQGNDRVLRLFRKRAGVFQGIIHEEVHVDGRVGELTNYMEHEGTKTLHDYFVKLKQYTDLEAERMQIEGRLPPFFRALAYPPAMWVLDYVLLGGFLDGWCGFLYHGLSCYYGWVKNFKARRRQTMNPVGMNR